MTWGRWAVAISRPQAICIPTTYSEYDPREDIFEKELISVNEYVFCPFGCLWVLYQTFLYWMFYLYSPRNLPFPWHILFTIRYKFLALFVWFYELKCHVGCDTYSLWVMFVYNYLCSVKSLLVYMTWCWNCFECFRFRDRILVVGADWVVFSFAVVFNIGSFFYVGDSCSYVGTWVGSCGGFSVYSV